MSKPQLLDLFCGGGGASMGYFQAGFEVIGVDLTPQKNYPFEFHQADAMTFPLDGFDVVHASPPCQRWSGMAACRPGLSNSHPALIDGIRERLRGRVSVIENVTASPLSGITLCGQMFGLRLYRHRRFECSEWLWNPGHPRHEIPASKAGHWRPGTVVSVAGNCAPIAEARAAMGIEWMNRNELAEAIPPAYTRWIGEQLCKAL